jgi:hypothetical protein
VKGNWSPRHKLMYQASSKSHDEYQRKVGSMLFAAISTRPDISFAVSRLARFNQNHNDFHHEAADRVIKYLYSTKNLCIQYGQDNSGESFICASDSSFADNTIDRKSSQGYIITLFGGAIGWRANKQNTVTTSSTEAELLVVSDCHIYESTLELFGLDPIISGFSMSQ